MRAQVGGTRGRTRDVTDVSIRPRRPAPPDPKPAAPVPPARSPARSPALGERLRVAASAMLDTKRVLALGAAGVFVVALVGVTAAWVHHVVQETVRADRRDELATLLETEVAAVDQGFDDATRVAFAAAEDSWVRNAVMIAVRDGADAPRESLEERISAYMRAGHFAAMRAIDVNGRVLFATDGAASDGHDLPLPVATEIRGPFVSEDGSTWRVRAPIRDIDDATVAALVFVLPAEVIVGPLALARSGETGESYALDRRGRFVSEGRAPRVQTHAVAGEELTFAAHAIARGQNGASLEPYAGTRARPVVGAFRWLAHYGIGVVVEIDADEAFRATVVLRRAFALLIALLALLVSLVFAGVVVLERYRGKLQMVEGEVARLGQYELGERLGAGGMGTVYRAEHALLRRPTAIKLIKPEATGDDLIERFEREVRYTASFSHPNTIVVYDYGSTDDGRFYYAMEYLEGVDLHRLVELSGPQTSGRVVTILKQICGSLAEAHAHGVVHRDIKPSNVMLTHRGGVPDVVKVLDFGLVKPFRDHGGNGRETRGGVIMGTPEFMAPEAFRASRLVSPQSDLYSLGCLAYFLLTGRFVFDADSVASLAGCHLFAEPVPPSARSRRVIDRGLETFVLDCLKKAPEERPEGALGALARLEALECGKAWTRVDAERWWRSHEAAKRAKEAPVAAAPLTVRSRRSVRSGRPTDPAPVPPTADEAANEPSPQKTA